MAAEEHVIVHRWGFSEREAGCDECSGLSPLIVDTAWKTGVVARRF
jgi:hypothetical protein